MNIINNQDGHKEIIDFAVDYLLRGKIVAHPTETVYGLGCDATNLRVIKRINALKGSAASKELLVLVSDLKMAKEYAVFGKQALRLVKQYWPGPLTLILTTTEHGKKILKSKTVAMRVSANALANGLVKKMGRPMVSTSANLSGQTPAHSGMEVANIFSDANDEPDIILDAGKLKKSKGSTIVDCTGDEIVVVRKGDVKI